MGLPVGRAVVVGPEEPAQAHGLREGGEDSAHSFMLQGRGSNYEMRADGPKLLRRGPAFLLSRGSLAVHRARRSRLLDEAIRA